MRSLAQDVLCKGIFVKRRKESSDYLMEVVDATRDLKTMHHIAELLGITHVHVQELLNRPGAPAKSSDFVSRVKFIMTLYRDGAGHTHADDKESLDPTFQTARLKKLQADRAEMEYERDRKNLVPLESIEDYLRLVAMECAMNLDGLVPEIQQMIPSMSQAVSDQIEQVIAECRNRMAEIRLPDEHRPNEKKEGDYEEDSLLDDEDESLI